MIAEKHDYYITFTCKQDTLRDPAVDDDPEVATDESILCAACFNPVTLPDYQISVSGSHTHIFANPHGLVYEIACFSSANGCKPLSPSSSEFSWFPGFVWKVGVCSSCALHLGWFFMSESSSFYGLIIERLVFP